MAKKPLTAGEIDDFINKLKDIEGNYKSLVEKMSKVQFEADEKGLEVVSKNLGQPVSQAPDNAASIGDTIHALEKQKTEAAESPPETEGK